MIVGYLLRIGIAVLLAGAVCRAGQATFRVGCLEYSGHTGQGDSEVKMQALYDGLNRVLDEQARAGTPLDLVVTGETPTLMGSEETMAKMAQAIPGRRTDRLGSIAAAHKVWLVADLLEWDGSGARPSVHNTQVVFDRAGRLVGTYRKIVLPPEEASRPLQPGSASVVIDTEFGRIGLITCWEVQFPERVADLMRLRPHLVVHPTAGDFRELLPYIARQYRVYFASASWSGPSLIVAPDGKILAEQLYDGGEPARMRLAVADIPRGPGAASRPAADPTAAASRAAGTGR